MAPEPIMGNCAQRCLGKKESSSENEDENNAKDISLKSGSNKATALKTSINRKSSTSLNEHSKSKDSKAPKLKHFQIKSNDASASSAKAESVQGVPKTQSSQGKITVAESSKKSAETKSPNITKNITNLLAKKATVKTATLLDPEKSEDSTQPHVSPAVTVKETKERQKKPKEEKSKELKKTKSKELKKTKLKEVKKPKSDLEQLKSKTKSKELEKSKTKSKEIDKPKSKRNNRRKLSAKIRKPIGKVKIVEPPPGKGKGPGKIKKKKINLDHRSSSCGKLPPSSSSVCLAPGDDDGVVNRRPSPVTLMRGASKDPVLGESSTGSGTGEDVRSGSQSSTSSTRSDEAGLYYTALFDFIGHNKDELIIVEGDQLMLVDDRHKKDGWMVLRAEKTGKTGFVPTDYVAVTGSLKAEPWFFGRLQQRQATKLVLNENLPKGTFLVWENLNEDNTINYCLTVRFASQFARTDHMLTYAKHYVIHKSSDGDYFITSDLSFSTVQDIVKHYSKDKGFLCSKLTRPCPRIIPRRKDLSYLTHQKWEIPRTQLKLVKRLGSGNFGEVWFALWNDTLQVAVKSVKAGHMTSQEFLKEAAVMKQLDHPNIIKLYGVSTVGGGPLYIITEYMRHGSLLSFLKSEPGKKLTQLALIDVAAQAANGMAYLEIKQLVHRDLAARNLLVGPQHAGIPVIKISDFGLARAVRAFDKYKDIQTPLPIKWTAPEAIAEAKFSIKSDVWSYGILLHEIFTHGGVPYQGLSNKQVYQFIITGKRLSRHKKVPPRVYEVMLKCWANESQKRPSFKTLFAFFDEYFAPAADD